MKDLPYGENYIYEVLQCIINIRLGETDALLSSFKASPSEQP